MGPIEKGAVQAVLDPFADHEIYIHLETTTGAYAAQFRESKMVVCAFIRNCRIKFGRGTIMGDGPYRVGLKMDQGWVYAEGLTDFEVDSAGRLLLAGHDDEGRLIVALNLSLQPLEI